MKSNSRNDEILSDDNQGNDWDQLQAVPDNEVTPYEEQQSDERIRLQQAPDDNETPFKN